MTRENRRINSTVPSGRSSRWATRIAGAEAFGVLDTRVVAFREMRIAQILAFVQKAKRVLSSSGVLHTLINRKCG